MSVTTIEKGRFTSSNGNGSASGMHGTLDRGGAVLIELENQAAVLPERFADLPAWLRNPLTKARGLILMVEKKASGNFPIRDGIMYALLAASLSFGATNYWKRQEEHDEMVRLRTLQEVQEKTNAERDVRIESARNFATVADKNIGKLEAKIDQFMQIYSIKNADKANLTFTRE